MNPEQSTRVSFGGSSRDEEQGSKGQRRTASSSGFLVDSFLPRSKSVRTSGPQTHRPEIEHRGKRGKSDDTVAPAKRSRFRWSRHKGSTKESDDVSQDTINEKDAIATPHQDDNAMVAESHGQSSSHQTRSSAESRDDHAGIGLDRDSLQIVNLALNLSESRRKGAGYNGLDQVPGGTWASSSDGRASAAGSLPSHSSYRGHDPTQSLRDDRVKSNRPPVSNVTNDVVNSLPKSAMSDPVRQEFSGGTLARAANARRYFELRQEYLRLLPSLPPLQSHESHSTTDSTQNHEYQSSTHRAYNPLQAIRNRKVRFRERCPMDPEAEGWNDIEKVHSWVNSVEAGYSHQDRTPLECLKLPPFQGRNSEGPVEPNVPDGDVNAASPPSSLRRISRTGSLKARRPRSDWLISPDELLADAAWVEDAQNKSKLINKDGNTLYPDPSYLVVHDVHQEQAQGRSSVGTGRPSSHASHSDARQSLSVDMKDNGRGRQPRQNRSDRSEGRPSSVSDADVSSKRRKFRIRSRSSSSSSADERPYRDSFLSNMRSPRRSVSARRRKRPNWIDKRGSVSSVPSVDDHYDPLSLTKRRGNAPTTGMDIGYFPSIASNLSPPSSRSSSPAKRGFTRAVGHRRAHSRNSFHRKGGDDDSSVDYEAGRKDNVPFVDSVQFDIEPRPLPAKASTFHIDGRRMNPHERKDSIPHESKLRGIFKGPGKIAGKVGNEVSKMGDFILKKDSVGHSRQSSLAISDDSDSDDDEVKGEKRGIPKAILRRLPTFSDDLAKSSPRTSDKSLAKASAQTPPTIIEPRDEEEPGSGYFSNSQGRLLDLQGDASNSSGTHQKRSGHTSKRVPRFLQFGPEIHTIRDEIRKGRIKDRSVPYSMTRPPVTGLAQAHATPMSSSRDVRPGIGQSRSWSISDRSVSVSIESGVPGKQEIERTRALLLSSGIKAREITRRAENVRNPPPEFLQRAFDQDGGVPSIPRLYEHELATRRLLKRIEASHSSFQNSIEHVPKVAFAPLKSQLSTLEDLVNKSLNTRVRAAGEEAENLSMQLNTTSTLAVKQLSDTLEHGLRKRHRRLRWLRRTGFVMLEWALIGLLWWVWLIVVAFKLLRKLLRGMGSGVRWILWL